MVEYLNIYEMVLNWKFSPGGFGNGMANWVYGTLRGSYLSPVHSLHGKVINIFPSSLLQKNEILNSPAGDLWILSSPGLSLVIPQFSSFLSSPSPLVCHITFTWDKPPKTFSLSPHAQKFNLNKISLSFSRVILSASSLIPSGPTESHSSDVEMLISPNEKELFDSCGLNIKSKPCVSLYFIIYRLLSTTPKHIPL